MQIKETGFILFLENYEENVQFYTDTLELVVRERKEGLVKLDFGGSYLMVENNGISNKTEKNRSQNPTVIRIEVDDIEGTVRLLRDKDVQVEVHKFNWGTIGVLIDPEGNKIELKEY